MHPKNYSDDLVIRLESYQTKVYSFRHVASQCKNGGWYSFWDLELYIQFGRVLNTRLCNDRNRKKEFIH